MLITVFLISAYADAGNKIINFQADTKLIESTAVSITLQDVKQLLEEGMKGYSVTFNRPAAEININLEILPYKDISTARSFPSSIFYPVHFYKWKSEPSPEGSALTLASPSEMGIVFGLYGLLQEKLGYKFYHPKDTYVPNLGRWTLPASFTFEAEPLFEKRGFHLHTMHPMELTEQLHSDMDGTAVYDIKEYVDWLVRNGQNVMQFWLLRTADRENWTEYAKSYIRYAKDRGVLTGAVISLSTLQQKAFQTVNLLKPYRSYTSQIDENLDWLLQVPFDFISIDFTMGEYLPDLSVILPETKKYLIQTIKKRYGVNVMENTHVIKRKHTDSPECSGKIIHSVMFYSISEESAPVYGNKNQQFMFDMMQSEKINRETWYWPESSYWVTFDTSIPLFLLPYLQSRHDDIEHISAEGIDGHVTFTSGWEWGYWMIDHSIARWSWHFRTDGIIHKSSPLQAVEELFDRETAKLFSDALDLQQKYLKDQKLISLLSAKTPFEELPWPFNKSFQPTGDYSLIKASLPFVGRKHREMIEADAELLDCFHNALMDIACRMKSSVKNTGDIRDKLRKEIIISMEITALRAKHRHYTLLAGAYRNHRLSDSSKYYLDTLLNNAEQTRLQAMTMVKEMERGYRYPVSLTARRMQSHTSYDFGYLYPVSDLFFWKREEQQVAGTRFDAFYMNIWSFWDTLGLDGLF
jgi:hypothetical protein